MVCHYLIERPWPGVRSLGSRPRLRLVAKARDPKKLDDIISLQEPSYRASSTPSVKRRGGWTSGWIIPSNAGYDYLTAVEDG
jgi:hypothetical protein